MLVIVTERDGRLVAYRANACDIVRHFGLALDSSARELNSGKKTLWTTPSINVKGSGKPGEL